MRLWYCSSKRAAVLENTKFLYVLGGSGSASVYDSGTRKDIKCWITITSRKAGSNCWMTMVCQREMLNYDCIPERNCGMTRACQRENVEWPWHHREKLFNDITIMSEKKCWMMTCQREIVEWHNMPGRKCWMAMVCQSENVEKKHGIPERKCWMTMSFQSEIVELHNMSEGNCWMTMVC